LCFIWPYYEFEPRSKEKTVVDLRHLYDLYEVSLRPESKQKKMRDIESALQVGEEGEQLKKCAAIKKTQPTSSIKRSEASRRLKFPNCEELLGQWTIF